MWKGLIPAVLTCTLAIAAQAPPDLGKIGPQVGARVADFSLIDQFGATRSLRSLAGKNGLMLVFFRSADW